MRRRGYVFPLRFDVDQPGGPSDFYRCQFLIALHISGVASSHRYDVYSLEEAVCESVGWLPVHGMSQTEIDAAVAQCRDARMMRPIMPGVFPRHPIIAFVNYLPHVKF